MRSSTAAQWLTRQREAFSSRCWMLPFGIGSSLAFFCTGGGGIPHTKTPLESLIGEHRGNVGWISRCPLGTWGALVMDGEPCCCQEVHSVQLLVCAPPPQRGFHAMQEAALLGADDVGAMLCIIDGPHKSRRQLRKPKASPKQPHVITLTRAVMEQQEGSVCEQPGSGAGERRLRFASCFHYQNAFPFLPSGRCGERGGSLSHHSTPNHRIFRFPVPPPLLFAAAFCLRWSRWCW